MPLTTTSARFTNPRDVLLAIQNALIAGLADIFPAETIMISDPDEWEDGAPEQQMSSSFICIAMTDSEFPDDVQIGGGANTCEELGGVVVYIFSDSRLDSTGQMPAVVFDPNEGLLELRRRVMRVLVGSDPLGDNAMPLVSQLIPVRRAAKPRKNPQGIWFTTLEFGTSYFLDLT